MRWKRSQSTKIWWGECTRQPPFFSRKWSKHLHRVL